MIRTSRKRETLAVGAMVVLAMAASATAQESTALPAAEAWVPDKAVMVLNVARPKALLDVVLNPKLIAAIEASPEYKAAAAKPGFKGLEQGIKFLEFRFKADWQTVLRRFTAGGVTWAIGPGGASLMIIDAADAEVLTGLHEFALLVTKGEAEKKGRKDPTSVEKYGEVMIWSLGPKEAHAIVGNRVMISNRVDVIKAALDMRDGKGGKSIASVDGYRRAMKAAGPDAAAALYVNTAVLNKLPKVAKALSGEANPLVALLAAPLTEAFGTSSWMVLAARGKGRTLTIDAITDGTIGAEGAAKFALAGGAMPNLDVPRRIAGMSLYRDLRGFYAAKDTLFPERTSGLIFFENMMGIFFTGRDLTDEVLAELGPHVRMVVAEQAYDADIGTPAVQIPAFALVVPMKNPEKFSRVMEEAWQKALGLVNFTRGQKAEPGLIIDRPVHKGTKYTVAAFGPPDQKGGKDIDVRFNFRPALASSNGYLILSSTDQLAEDVMDALAKETARAIKPTADTHSALVIDGKQLVSILQANRANFIRQNMVEKGNTREQAESEINTMVTIVKYIANVNLAIGAAKERSKAALQIQFALPSTAGEK